MGLMDTAGVVAATTRKHKSVETRARMSAAHRARAERVDRAMRILDRLEAQQDILIDLLAALDDGDMDDART
jgi:hypothetical protein